ncbi:MAG TPA: response regulator [Oligoflexia bacterium]|nr:response regulator [Oligoflexia bacterium]HMP26987.1 response regulator [Oligoflexia bacterium]
MVIAEKFTTIKDKLFELRCAFFPTSVSDCLAQVLSENHLRQIAVGVRSEQRDLISLAAKVTGITEDELLSKISRKLKVDFATYLQPLGKRFFDNFLISFEECSQEKIFPVVKLGEFVGIASPEPFKAKLFLQARKNELSKISLYLTSGRELERALKASKLLIEEDAHTELKGEQAKKEKIAFYLLENIAKEALSYKAKTIKIFFGKSQIIYEFVPPQGGIARGALAPQIRHSLLALLLENSAAPAIMLPSGKQIAITFNSDQSEFILALSKSDCAANSDCKKEDFLNSTVIAGGLTTFAAQSSSFPNFEKVAEATSQLASGLNCLKVSPVTSESASELLTAELPKSSESSSKDSLKRRDFCFKQTGEIVIIEDNKIFASVLEKFLDDYGFSCRSFADGESGAEYLRACVDSGDLPLLIICDMHLPRKNGLEITRELRNKECFDKIPIIALTSDDDFDLEVEFARSGVDAFVSKARDPKLLLAQVERLISKRKAA